jgi:hypothetical protein
VQSGRRADEAKDGPGTEVSVSAPEMDGLYGIFIDAPDGVRKRASHEAMPLLYFIAWLVPFDLPMSQVLHWAVADVVGNGYLLLLPSVVLAACVASRISAVSRRRLPPALLPWAISGFCGVLGCLLAGK